MTDTTPTSGTQYYPLYATGKSGNQTVRANEDFYYWDEGTTSYISVGSQGSSPHKGGVTLHSGNGTSKYANIVPGNLTGMRTATLQDASGTVAVYSCGTTDLVAGSSSLETGKLYFVYE